MSNLHFEDVFTPTRISRFLLAIAAALLLNACSSPGGNDSGDQVGRYSMRHDAPPDGNGELDPDNIPDAVPVDEPRTAAGNKTPYTVLGETYDVMPESTGYEQVGKASWYGKKFHGFKTSNGETYSMYQMSGAHRTLPIPSYVRVTNLDNGRSGIVRINDRGPFHSDRVIDVSYAAAVKLGMINSGTARVKVEAITPATSTYAAREANRDALTDSGTKRKSGRVDIDSLAVAHTPATRPVPAEAIAKPASSAPLRANAGSTWLQAGAFRNENSAHALGERIASITGQPVKIETAEGLHKVRIGPLADPQQVSEISDLLVQNNFGKPQVVYF